ncbi:MAG: alpha/beta hydrolase family protein [Thiobacillus sp.]
MRLLQLCFWLLAFPAWAQAEPVVLEMRPRISASAEYLSGQRDKPAVLLLHGFLQTREFSTISIHARGLNDAGYTVLSPSLSLGIPGRKQSLACEAVHRHGLDDDVAEIARWVDWLKARGHTRIVLLGHSFGSLQLLAYLDGKPDAAVKAFVGASLIEAQIGTTNRTALITRLDSQQQRRQRSLIRQQLSFCKNYLSTPDALLSYVRWDQPRILKALRASPVPVKLIMGNADALLGRNWLQALEHIQIPMAVVLDANHFMDGQHEFDLLEHVLAFLTQFQAPSR